MPPQLIPNRLRSSFCGTLISSLGEIRSNGAPVSNRYLTVGDAA